jgi:MFS family permease
MSPTVRPWTVLAKKNFALFWSSLLVLRDREPAHLGRDRVAGLRDDRARRCSWASRGFSAPFIVPLIAFAFTGGWLADRVERRRLLLATQVLALFLSLALAVLTDRGRIAVWHIYAILFAQSALMSFDLPTRNALIPNLVVEEHLATALRAFVALRQAAFLAGLFVAGAIIAYGGRALVLLHRCPRRLSPSSSASHSSRSAARRSRAASAGSGACSRGSRSSAKTG